MPPKEAISLSRVIKHFLTELFFLQENLTLSYSPRNATTFNLYGQPSPFKSSNTKVGHAQQPQHTKGAFNPLHQQPTSVPARLLTDVAPQCNKGFADAVDEIGGISTFLFLFAKVRRVRCSTEEYVIDDCLLKMCTVVLHDCVGVQLYYTTVLVYSCTTRLCWCTVVLHDCVGVQLYYTTVLVYSCTTRLCWCTVVLHDCVGVQLYYTTVLVYSCTTRLCWCTVVLHDCVGVQLYYTTVLVYSCTTRLCWCTVVLHDCVGVQLLYYMTVLVYSCCTTGVYDCVGVQLYYTTVLVYSCCTI